ncbi:MAG TPA: pyridoxal-dependent decarboxylase [Candidatus Polarisedimenticolia bacterium]|nr:pyridoxal-dependent decarboxylase [Candidatus Polarisedimenticolia bacterium]
MEWSEDDIRRFGGRVADLVAEYFAGLESRAIGPLDVAGLPEAFAAPLPEEGSDPFRLLDEVRGRVVAGSFHLGAPRYFGLFNPTPTVIGVFADAIASMLNQNMAAWCHGPAGAQIEKTVIRWMCDLIGFPDGAFGTMTSGGTVANLTGLKVALSEKVPEVRRIGVAAAEGRPTFYVSTQAHYSVDRLADVLGLGSEGMRRIQGDGSGRIVPELLERQIRSDIDAGRLPFAVIGIAGTTTSGAIDPLDELADLCARHRLWCHVDAAWGGAVRMSERHRGLLSGIERADSVTLDPHKWFSVPYAAGAIVVRDGAALRRAFEVKPHYVSDRAFVEHEDLNLFQFGIHGSRRFDALKVWLSLRQYGRRGYAEAVDRQIALAEYLARKVEASEDLIPASPPSLGVFCFRYLPPSMRRPAAGSMQDGAVPDEPRAQRALDEHHRTIQDALERRGRAWISTSMLAGRRVFRFCATSYLSRERHVDELLEELRLAAASAGEPACG